jgi:hypothetical protein
MRPAWPRCSARIDGGGADGPARPRVASGALRASAQLLKTTRVVPVVVFLRAGRFPRRLTLGDDGHAYLSSL